MPNIVLAMFKSDGTRRDFPLVKERVIIGRKVNCDLRIPLTSVSRQHCELTVNGSGVRVKDLGSSNGTYHNSQRVQEAHLSAGDELVIGPVVFTLVVDGQPEDIKPVRTIVGGEGSERAPAVQAAGGESSPTVVVGSDDDVDIAGMLEEDDAIPTVDIADDEDDDPIAALESLAGDDDDASSADFGDIDFFDIDDDDDDDK